ncbi:proprotein convertase P-domain-containing protein [Erythrobacter sp. Alg231-14]|uniref:proprotein convertase P-domain-containing protein n=1 Tax=Erythrobacter sp. Alg231-14 TaxID=1922225 RepID=UPI00307BBFF4
MRFETIIQSGATLLSAAIKLLIAGLCMAFAQPALAQSTFSYTVTDDGAIDGTTTCAGPANPLVRNFSVADSFTVGDVNLGFFATHTWRGDIQVTLISPEGTEVVLVVGETGSTNGDNLNVLLDDAAATVVNATNITSAHSATEPLPYENTRRPNNPLSAFNGEASLGTWRLEACDLLSGFDDGLFSRADLFLTSQPSDFADLSLTKILIGSPPIQGGNATWRLTVVNASDSSVSADNVLVEDTLPAGFTFSNSSGDGAFNPANGEWDVGTLDPGDSAILTITGTISSSAGTTITNSAEIIASSVFDPDSTPNNGSTTEDDFATSALTVQSGRAPGQPPLLSCPAGATLFDWDTIDEWVSGSTDNSYDFGTLGQIRFELDNDGVFLDAANFGGQSPNTSPVFSGGLPTTEAALNMLANQGSPLGEVEIEITLPRSLTGVQFTIFDVDFASGQFADRVEVVGNNGGANFDAVLTNGNVNFIQGGNVAIGDGASGSDQALGNVVVTFTQAVETIIIRYGNHTTAPNDPGQQAIGIHDITVCNPFTTLDVTKVSSIIFDPVNGAAVPGGVSPKAIPGAMVQYVITVTNTGSEATDADSVVVWDDGPSDAKMCLLGRSGGPVIFGDPGNNSGLNYDYGGTGSVTLDLALDTDDLEFSEDDGSDNFEYTPIADDDGCDTEITDFRVRPGGAFDAGRSFTITVRYQID